MSRARRNPNPGGIIHYAAPAAFLAGVTIAVLLVHSGLTHHHPTTPPPATVISTGRTATATTTGKSRATAKRFYVVQIGDTFGTIASKEGITVEQLQALNPGVSSNALQVGQKLRVK
jgi:LysM repeat protein